MVGWLCLVSGFDGRDCREIGVEDGVRDGCENTFSEVKDTLLCLLNTRQHTEIVLDVIENQICTLLIQ